MTTINSNGGTIYLREDSGRIEYSSDGISYGPINPWPVTIVNTNPGSSNVTTVQLTENITLSNTTVGTGSSGKDLYFICGSEYITFDGQGFIITINNVTDYPGLIQNGTSSSNGETNITIQNIGLTTSSGSTLVSDGGWITHAVFGRGTSGGSINITNCFSTGNISTEGGGICGRASFRNTNGSNITISKCYSTGSIGNNAGGILARRTGYQFNSGSLSVNNCYSTGDINQFGGGIIGYRTFVEMSGGTVTIEECYSTGTIGTDAGGIFGSETLNSATGGSISTKNCYSLGQIGNDAGGIYGSNTRESSTSSATVAATNCYTVGNTSTSDTGIYGPSDNVGAITNCISKNASHLIIHGLRQMQLQQSDQEV